jgi:multiple sugar transport system substrate-binding protein
MNKVSRRKFLQGLGLAAAGAAAAACQPKTVIVKETVEVEKEVEKVVKETVVVEKEVTVAMSSEPMDLNFWIGTGPETEAIAAEFEEQHPNVTVQLSEGGDMVFGDQKYMTAVAAGKGPDVSLQNRHTFQQFAAKGMYQDVTPYFEDVGMSRSDFFPVQLAETSWEGRIYGLPRETDTRLLYWNKKHFEEVGLDPEQPPETWAELEAYTDKLNVKNAKGDFERMGFVPYLVGNSWMWLYGFLNKAPAISEDKRTILCDDDRWTWALQWMVDFYDKYLGSFEITSAFSELASSQGLGDLFVSEKVSMVAHCDTCVGGYLRNPDLDWDVAPMPIPPEGEKSSWSCGWSVVMPPSAKYPEMAWELMRWWTGIEGWHARARAYKDETVRVWNREQIEGEPLYYPWDAIYIPAVKMLEEEYISVLPDLLKKHWDISMDCLANWTHGCGTEMGVAALEYWVEIDNAVRAALAHKMTPAEAMQQCQEKVQEATDRAWEAIESQ